MTKGLCMKSSFWRSDLSLMKIKLIEYSSKPVFFLFQMVKKKIDNRLRVLIENGIRTFHRSLIVVVGDKGRDQVISYFIFLFN
jgi:hypothetical protein